MPGPSAPADAPGSAARDGAVVGGGLGVANIPVDDLTPGQRVTISLWRRSHRELPHHPAGRGLAEAAAHAVLARLRQTCPTTEALWRHYEEGNAADFALIASLVPSPPDARTPTEREQPFWTIREAAFWLRWQELTGDAG